MRKKIIQCTQKTMYIIQKKLSFKMSSLPLVSRMRGSKTFLAESKIYFLPQNIVNVGTTPATSFEYRLLALSL